MKALKRWMSSRLARSLEFAGLVALAGLAVGAAGFLAGCGEVVADGGVTDVYGDYGYAGPWVWGRADGGYHVDRPPYEHFDGDHARPEGPAPRPGGGGGGGHAPSIPNRPRPSGGGGGHPSGGGGGHAGGGSHHP